MNWHVKNLCLLALLSSPHDHPVAGDMATPAAIMLTAELTKPNSTEKSELKGSANGRLREGAKLIDQIGEFQKSGDRINFFSKEGFGVLRVLENLALERVVRVLDDNPSMRDWSVSGVITEYRGENYLLLTRAVLKARSPAANPRPRKSDGLGEKQ